MVLSHQEFIETVIIYKVIIAKQPQLNTIPCHLFLKHHHVQLIGTCLLINMKYFKSCTITLNTGMLFSKQLWMNRTVLICWEEPPLESGWAEGVFVLCSGAFLCSGIYQKGCSWIISQQLFCFHSALSQISRRHSYARIWVPTPKYLFRVIILEYLFQ